MMSATRIPTGVHLDDFRTEPKQALKLASELGFAVVQIGAVRGPISPEQLSGSGRRHLRRLATGLGLSIVALRADFGGLRFLDAALIEKHVRDTRLILELARELGASIVTAPLGKIDSNGAAQYDQVKHALAEIIEHADKLDQILAVETSVVHLESIESLLDDISCPNLRVCYDPAELLMQGINPLTSIETFVDRIALAYVRDAQRGSPAQAGRETNLGQGELGLHSYLAGLEAAGYAMPLVVRRSDSADPLNDLRACKEYLDSVLVSKVRF